MKHIEEEPLKVNTPKQKIIGNEYYLTKFWEIPMSGKLLLSQGLFKTFLMKKL